MIVLSTAGNIVNNFFKNELVLCSKYTNFQTHIDSPSTNLATILPRHWVFYLQIVVHNFNNSYYITQSDLKAKHTNTCQYPGKD